MLLSSVLSMETSDAVRIYLHHEGIFWKAYERSAYLFLQKTKMDDKVKCRKVKSLGTTVCSIVCECVSLIFSFNTFLL